MLRRPPLPLAFIALAAFVLIAGCAKKRVEPPPLWEPIALGSDAEFEDLWFADSLNGWAVGGGPSADGGIVGRTRDGGRIWSYSSGLMTTGSRGGLAAVRFFGPNRGLIATDAGNVFVTDDGGENWRLARYGTSMSDNLADFDFVDPDNGWAVGGGGVYRTRDGGVTWVPACLSEPYDRELMGHAIEMIDARRGWLVGPHGTLRGTRDGGYSWEAPATPLAAEERPFLSDVCFPDPMHGWVVGEEGTILHTSDGGDTWIRQDSGLPDARSKPQPEIIQRRRGVIDTLDLGGRTPSLSLTAVQFLDGQRGWIAGHYGPGGGRSLVLHTGDGGATWQREAESEGESLLALYVLDSEHAWAIGGRSRPGTHVVLRHIPAADSSAVAAAGVGR